MTAPSIGHIGNTLPVSAAATDCFSSGTGFVFSSGSSSISVSTDDIRTVRATQRDFAHPDRDAGIVHGMSNAPSNRVAGKPSRPKRTRGKKAAQADFSHADKAAAERLLDTAAESATSNRARSRARFGNHN
jgi:hypothetical protein